MFILLIYIHTYIYSAEIVQILNFDSTVDILSIFLQPQSMPLPTLTGGTSLYLELSKEEEAEEVERVNALLQRKNLLRDLGVVDLVYELLHSIHSQPGPTKVLHKQVNVSLPKTRESISQV